MRLAVFDLDGTLADTLKVDHRCFLQAFRDEFGITVADEDWTTYRHTTDSGITPEVLERAWGRPATPAEVARHRERFVALLEGETERVPHEFAQVPGAAELLAALAAAPGWGAVVATGSWRRSALLKLATAGLGAVAPPVASADDALEREAIVRHGLELARGDGHRFESVVLLGDKPWDARAAARLGLGFVGVATADGDALAAAGAGLVLDDFRDTGGCLAALAAAAR